MEVGLDDKSVSIGLAICFLDTLLQYYLTIPDLDVLSDQEWAYKLYCLQEIRRMEAEGNR